MIERAPPFRINADARIARVRAAIDASDFKGRDGERREDLTPSGVDAKIGRATNLFRYETGSAAFATQALAQAMKTPRATSLEGAIAYEGAPRDFARLIGFA